jgi:hypothetical protein
MHDGDSRYCIVLRFSSCADMHLLDYLLYVVHPGITLDNEKELELDYSI